MITIMIIWLRGLTVSRQGLWLGLFATSGSVARVAGPLLVTEIYQQFGTYAMLIVVGVTMVRPKAWLTFLIIPLSPWKGLAMFLVIVGWKTLVPTHKKKSDDTVEGGKTGAGIPRKITPELVINPIKEESESESEEYETEEEKPKDFGRKLIIYDDDVDQTGMFAIEK